MTPEEIRRREKNGRRLKISSQKKRYYSRVKTLSPEQKWEREQRILWFKLRYVFTHKEYVAYEDLPETLKAQVLHFEEFTFPL